MDVPLLDGPVPHPPSYHFQNAPWPSEPPFNVNVVLCPMQMLVVPLMLVTGTEVSLTVRVKLLQAVLLQVPSARAKYVYVPAAAGDTTSEVPVAMDVPPQLPRYHLHVAPLPSEPPFKFNVEL
jgi:hypothetical protein